MCTLNGKEAISKGYQIAGLVLIQLCIINNDLKVILCQHKSQQVRNFALMNKIASIPNVVMLCLGATIAHHQRT